MENMLSNAKYMADKLLKTGKFEIINKDVVFPLITVKLKNSVFTVYDLSDKLREKGWIVPAYTLPKNAEDIAVLRMVIKENFGRDMVECFLEDVNEACRHLESEEEKVKKEDPSLLY
jgi:glutamate decarboxylase